MYPAGYSRNTLNTALLGLISLLVIALASLGSPLSAVASDPFAGNIKTIESESPAGQVSITRQGRIGKISAQVGDALFAGDMITTAPGVKASVQLSDASLMFIGPGSSVEMKNYLLNTSLGKRNVTLKALQGTIRFMIAKLFKDKATGNETTWKDSNLIVETHSAVAGVRGTDFTMTIGDGEVEIAVFEGAVSVKSASGSVAGETLLNANQACRVLKSYRPGPASVLTPQAREKLMRHTTPANDLRSLTGKAGPGGKEKRGGKLSIARDLASGLSLKEIMNDAVREGVNIHVVVAEAIAQGVDPSLVVYTAITEGYAPQTVVKSALKSGAPLDTVVNAAMSAGADKKSVYVGAAAAGAPPASVANAISSTSAPASPVFGYTSPVEAQPSVYTPPAPAAIGGGGGGTPSTKPASPYKPKS
jgi:hypothetical protein